MLISSTDSESLVGSSDSSDSIKSVTSSGNADTNTGIMSPKTNCAVGHFICAHCTKFLNVFKSRSGLIRHAKRAHPDVPRKVKKRKSVEAEESKKVIPTSVRCREDSCTFQCKKIGQLRIHLETEHNFKIQPPETMSFDSMESFNVWRKEFESSTESKFIRRWTRADGAYEFVCNRNGSYRSQSKGFRQPRLGGSLKSGGHCTARIIVFDKTSKPEQEEEIRITLYPTHYGHSTYLRLSQKKVTAERRRQQLMSKSRERLNIIEGLDAPIPPTDMDHELLLFDEGVNFEVRTSPGMELNQSDHNSLPNYVLPPQTQVPEEHQMNESTPELCSQIVFDPSLVPTSEEGYEMIFVDAASVPDNVVLSFPIHEVSRLEMESVECCDHIEHQAQNAVVSTAINVDMVHPVVPNGSCDTIILNNQNGYSTFEEASETYDNSLTPLSSAIMDKPESEEIVLQDNDIHTNMPILLGEMDRLYALKPYLQNIQSSDTCTRISSFLTFVHSAIMEVLNENA